MVGVLALQGAFEEHLTMLERIGVSGKEVRSAQDLTSDIDRLIIPGGESTVMNLLIEELDMKEPLRTLIEGGMPVMGTCAGLILLARHVDGEPNENGLATMDISVKRNAFGRQLGSTCSHADFAGHESIPLVFIRAPHIESVGSGVEVLARLHDRIVAARQKNMLATSFHPEMIEDTTIHTYFCTKLN